MEETASVETFAKRALEEPVSVVCDALDMSQNIRALTSGLKSAGLPGFEISRLLRHNLSVICPECAYRANGLVVASLKIREDSVGEDTSEKNTARRLIMGGCPECGSRKVMLVWGGYDYIRGELRRRAEELAADEESGLPENLLSLVLTPEALSFASETLQVLIDNGSGGHRQARSRRVYPNQCMLISAVHESGEAASNAFDEGYMALLAQLLDESEYDRGGLEVAHWTCIFNPAKKDFFLSLIPDAASLKKSRMFIPEELLSRQELRVLIKHNRSVGPKKWWQVWR